MTGVKDILEISFVSLLWGCTNPLMRIGAQSMQASEETLNRFPLLLRPVIYLWKALVCWKFSLPFLFNQLASILNVWLLATKPLTLVVPIVNSLTLLFTALAGRALGEASESSRILVAGTLIVTGIAMTLYFD